MKRQFAKFIGEIWRAFLGVVFALIMLSGMVVLTDWIVRGQEPPTRDIFRSSPIFPGDIAHSWAVWDAQSDDPKPAMPCAVKDWPSGIIEYCTGYAGHEIGNHSDSVPVEKPWQDAPLLRRTRGNGGRELPTRKAGN